jgi:hypothetical protein
MVEDTVTVAGISANVHFGAITAESQGFSKSDVDGIMGIAYTQLYPQAGDSVIGTILNDTFIDFE